MLTRGDADPTPTGKRPVIDARRLDGIVSLIAVL